MVLVLCGRAADAGIDTRALHGMFRLRSEVFHERLGWDVSIRGGIERDHYDDQDPVYLIADIPGRGVVGCMRLLPTTGPNMLCSTFPELLAGERAPCCPRVWDISRFAVACPAGAAASASPGSSAVTVALVRALHEHALAQGIGHGVAVVSLGLERILRRLGLPLRRFGDGRDRRVGDVRAVACWIDMTREVRDALRRAESRAA